MKRIAILGSTGSIGTQTLEVVENNQDIQVTALAAGSNIVLLEEQIRKFHPALACVWDEKKAAELRTNIADLSVKVVSGMDGLLEVAVQPEAEILVTAIVGMIGIRPTIAAMKAGKNIALANKETLVTAGHIIMPLAKEVGVKILPVDSEHSAIFQSLNGEDKKAINKILLTASGGPFRGWTKEQLAGVRPEDALKHPNWTMGRKITIDSSTMVNKGLEVMEARWLFGADYVKKHYSYKDIAIPKAQFTGEVGYFVPFFSDRGRNVFFSAGLSALAGYETTNWNCKLLYDGATLKNDGCFIYGFAPAFEMEAFLSDRLVFLFNVRQRIFFGSSVGNFHTVAAVGVKYIFN